MNQSLIKVSTIWILISINTAIADDCAKLKKDAKQFEANCMAEITDLKSQLKQQQDLITLTSTQRDQALKQLSERPTPLPWYFWVGTGAVLGGFLMLKVQK